MSGRRLTVVVDVKLPDVPNFLIMEGGAVDGKPIDIAHVDPDALRLLGAAWTEELVANALRRAELAAET